MEFVVRAAVPEDATAIAAIRVASWREAYAHILSAEFLAAQDPTQGIDYWGTLIESGRASMPVAEVDGEVLGFAVAGATNEDGAPRDLLLGLIYQLSSLHGSGSGQALLDAAIGNSPAYLWTAEDNPRAIAFYRRNGFEPDGARQVAEAWENLAEIRMVR